MVSISTAPHKPDQFHNRAFLQLMAPKFFPGQYAAITLYHHRHRIKGKLTQKVGHRPAWLQIPRFTVADDFHSCRLISPQNKGVILIYGH